MAMTGSEFRDYIVRTFKRTDKNTEIYEATTDVINYIKEMHNFEDYKTTKANATVASLGTYSFDIESDCDHIIGDVKVQSSSNSKQLIKITREEYNQLYPNQDDTDVNKAFPQHFCIFGGKVFLGPVPDSISYEYEYDYVTFSGTVITSGTTSVPFCVHNRLMLKNLVLGQLFADLGEDESATKHQNIGNELLQVLVNKEKDVTDAPVSMEYRDV